MQRSNDKPRKLKLLAPAKDCEIAREAIIHGADAVYIGADAFGARASATNSTADIARLVDFAHAYNARIYVTLNTLIYDSELAKAERLIRDIYRAGADALIVQDMSVLRMDIPPIALHASTQCDTRTPAKARFLEDCGFSQIVLARELSFGEIKQISQATTVPLEAFVHGALCVSYSGDCQASLLSTGRSANRGECAQMCRLNYRLTDSEGNPLAADAHYLSLRDMNRLDRLGDLADAGVSSFKIEGRLKDSAYVRNVVAAYSLALDKLIAASDGAYVRASSGEVSLSLQPDVERSFNRRFTNYFLDGRPANGQKMSSLDSPKWIGNKVATVIRANGNRIEVNAIEKLSNGDGLGYFGADGKFKGFRLNRVEGRTIHTLSPLGIAPGTVLYRNRDKRLDDRMTSPTAERRIRLDAMLRRVDSRRVALQLTDENGLRAEATAEIDFQHAHHKATTAGAHSPNSATPSSNSATSTTSQATWISSQPRSSPTSAARQSPCSSTRAKPPTASTTAGLNKATSSHSRPKRLTTTTMSPIAFPKSFSAPTALPSHSGRLRLQIRVRTKTSA